MEANTLLKVSFSSNADETAHKRLLFVAEMDNIECKKVSDNDYLLSANCIHLLLSTIETLSTGEQTSTFVVYFEGDDCVITRSYKRGKVVSGTTIKHFGAQATELRKFIIGKKRRRLL